jgi:hypothetical protein
MTRSAPKPPTISRTRAMRSSGERTSSMFTVASAPNFRASLRRGSSGAPTQITRPRPISCAAATARMPIGPEPWITTGVAPLEAAGAGRAVEGADAGGQRLGERAEAQGHVVVELVDLGAGQHVEVDVDVFGPAAPQVRRLVEAEIAPVVDGRQALVGVLGIVDAVVAVAAGHERRDHDLRADGDRLAHEVLGEALALLDDDAADLVAEGEGPRQGLRPMALRMCWSVPQTPQAPILISAAFFGTAGHGTVSITGLAPGPAKVATRMSGFAMASPSPAARYCFRNSRLTQFLRSPVVTARMMVSKPKVRMSRTPSGL